MTISRRTLGLGLLGFGLAATGGYAVLRDNPAMRGLLGERTKLFGFIGGEKQALMEDPEAVKLLGRAGLELDARVAGSVEMVREQALLSQKPDFLWPSSSIMVEIARQNVKVRRDQVVLNSPITIYSWEPVAQGLVAKGLASRTGSGHYQIDLKAFLDAILRNARWTDLGVSMLYGPARIVSTDPNRSNSGFMFAGLALNLLADSVASMQDLQRAGGDVQTIFTHMGFKSPSSGKLFDQYLAGGPGSEPMIVGYENQLVEWALADPDRWSRVINGNGARPVLLYPRPTVFSAHPVIAISEQADQLLDVMLGQEMQDLAWQRHGFRGPLGAVSGELSPDLSKLLMPQIEATLPLPSASVMLALLERLRD